jgi:hypothetical protein
MLRFNIASSRSQQPYSKEEFSLKLQKYQRKLSNCKNQDINPQGFSLTNQNLRRNKNSFKLTFLIKFNSLK